MPSAATPTPAGDLADQLVDDILRSCPLHQRGTRPIHAPGIAATGWFSATPVAPSLTTAAHFDGSRIPVTVRFSNGTGELDKSDSAPEVRGMATKFHLGPVTCGQGGVLHSPDDTDLIAMSLPMFMVDNVAQFRRFVAAATPAPPKRRAWWRTLLEKLRLDTPYPTPAPDIPSNDQGVFEFASHYPPAGPAIAALSNNFVPESYLTCSYHAVHAFSLTAPDGATHWARFHWEPVDGVQSAPTGSTGNFLRGGLAARITSGHASFVLRAQLAEAGDNLTDPTRPWPVSRPRVVLGHLHLTDVAEDQVQGCELLSFNPSNVVPGIGLSDDPILAVRGPVYHRSYVRRLEQRT